MVRGLDTFKEYFEKFPENYIIIGGTACDIIIEEAGFTPRATRDIDMILVVEALTSDFVKQFWKFIDDGNYEVTEKSEDERNYYRFMKPEKQEFPFQIELFSRTPDAVDLEEPGHLTPIPTEGELSSLSAILMDEAYYNFMLEHRMLEGDLHYANKEALICLKAKAFIEISERIADGSTEDKKHLKKHKADIFRLVAMFARQDEFELPESIKADMQDFINMISEELPDKAIFKSMGMGSIDSNKLFEQLVKSFGLTKKEG
ncbi:MAG: hypothetical protein GQ574_29130 [Crocinitomix sp.]|nr:hypothetical protein [Crocinitomix sp.]